MHRVIVTACVVIGLLCGVWTVDAVSATRALVAFPYAAQELTAYGGYVVFSQSDASSSRWRLMVWHGGVISALPVPLSSRVFDADAGPDARGRPAVVYSRCVTEPSAAFYDWAQASGCHVYEVSLLGGPERRVNGLGEQGASDSTPSIWRGAIAFARVQPSSRPHVSRIFLWRAGRPLRRLAGGTVPCRPARACPPPGAPRAEAWVAAMDLGPRMLAFDWQMRGENVFGSGGSWEMRADPLTGGRPGIADVGVRGEVCLGGESGGPFSPNVVGDSIFYALAFSDPCVGDSSNFASFQPRTHSWQAARSSSGVIGAVARDAAITYWLRVDLGPGPRFDKAINQGDCVPTHESCTLMRTSDIPLRPNRSHYRPSPPTGR